MSDTKEEFTPGVDTAVPPATAPPIETDEDTDTAPTFGIEVNPTKVYDEKTNKSHDATGIKISPALFLRDLKGSMKKFSKSMRGGAKVADQKEYPDKPPEDQNKSTNETEESPKTMEEGEVNWKELQDELHQGLKEADKRLKEVNWREVQDGMDKEWKEAEQRWKEVNWREVQDELDEEWKEAEKSWKEANWREVQDELDKEWKEADKRLKKVDWEYVQNELDKEWKETDKRLKEVDWDEVQNECKKVIDEVDWKQVYACVQEGAWNEVHRQFSEGTKDFDWKGVFSEVKEGQGEQKTDVQDDTSDDIEVHTERNGKVTFETDYGQEKGESKDPPGNVDTRSD